jgi:hypothetical protein
MKQIALLFVILSLFSCSKEKLPDTIVGAWTLTQINSGDSSSILLSQTEVSVEFKDDGSFDMLGPKANYTFLQDYNRYEIVSSDRIRFFNTASTGELFAVFRVGNTLSLSYEVRCPYEEKFRRL